MSPNHVIIAGMPRSATTYLYHAAQDHPDIFLPYLKESNFFVTNEARGPEWYWSLFEDASPGQVTFDISPATFIDPEADARVLEHCPDARIIVMVRDPLEWCLSFYSQFRSFDYTTPDFATFAKGHTYKHGVGKVDLKFDDNFVPKRIEAMMKAYGDRLLLLSYRLTRDNRLEAFRIIEEFSGIRPHFSAETLPDLRINASGRRNLRFVSHLLSRDWLIRGIDMLGVAKPARKVRSWFDRTSAKSVQPPEKLYTQAQLAINKAMFSEQQAWVDTLFSNGLALRGTGEPFVSKQASGPTVK